jgi:hypothetical protein
MAEPIMKFDPNGQAPLLSYQLPDATSYPGRNYVRLEFPEEVFRPELASGTSGIDSSRAGRGGVSAGWPGSFERSSIDPVLAEVVLPPGVGLSVLPDGRLDFQSTTPLDSSLVRLRREDLVSMRDAGLRPAVVRSLTGALTLNYNPPSVPPAGEGATSSGGAGNPLPMELSIEISSPGPDAEIKGPVGGVDLWVLGDASVTQGLGIITDADVSIDDGAWTQATLKAPEGFWGTFELNSRIAQAGWHELKVRVKAGKGEKIVKQRFRITLEADASADTTPPVVKIIDPPASPMLTSATGSGQFEMQGTSSDAVGVTAVEISVDGTNSWIGVRPKAAGDFSTWSATIVAEGPGEHVVRVRASDAAKNAAIVALPFTITQRQPRQLLRSYIMLVESYRLSSFLGRYGAGRVLKTFSLLPGERTKISVKSWMRTSATSTAASSIVDSLNSTSAAEFSSALQRENTDKETSADEFKWKIEGEVEQGWGTGRAKISAGAAGGCNGARERFGKTVAGVTDKHIAEASSKRDVTINSEYERTVEVGEETSIEREIQNINASRTINFVFRQMNQEFISILHLVDVRVAFVRVYDVGLGADRTEADYLEARLMELPSLLERAIVPSKRADVEETILDALRNVADYQDRLHDITETVVPKNARGDDVPEAGYLRIRRNLTHTYSPDPEDARANVKVQGIIVAATTNTMRTEGIIVDSLLGQGNGLDSYSQGLQEAAVEERVVANDHIRQETEAGRQLIDIVAKKDLKAATVYSTLNPPLPATEFTLNISPDHADQAKRV